MDVGGIDIQMERIQVIAGNLQIIVGIILIEMVIE